MATQAAARDRAALSQAQAVQTAAEKELKQTINRTKKDLDAWGDAWRDYAANNQGQFPIDFDQARPFLPEGDPMENDLVPAQFEIIQQALVGNLFNPNQIIVLRQKESVQTPGNANWLRTYLFADGHTEVESTPDGNFEPWESQHRAPNP
jgi:prepilin-type processing-associated H-X9-DG protein